MNALLHYMRVDHRCLEALVAEKHLHGANIAAVFQQVCCKAMAQGVAAGGLCETRLAYCMLHGSLHGGFRSMMPSTNAVSRIYR